MSLLSFLLQLGNSTPPPVAMKALAANFIGQADLDCPVPLIERVLQKLLRHKTHGVSSSDLAGDLFCCLQPCPNSPFHLAGYIITAVVSTHWYLISLEAACLGACCGIAVVAKS